MQKRFSLEIVVLALVTTLGFSREYVVCLDFKDAFGKSDVVVVATAIKTDVVEKETTLEDYPALGVSTIFKVEAILKGSTNLTHVSMFHYKLTSNTNKVQVVFNGPATVDFPTSNSYSRTYMLFLNRDEKKRLVPVYGQGNAAGSVYTLLPEEWDWIYQDK